LQLSQMILPFAGSYTQSRGLAGSFLPYVTGS
jgi:hypothetical protein